MAARPRSPGAQTVRRRSEATPPEPVLPPRQGPPWWPRSDWDALAAMEIARTERHRHRLCCVLVQIDPPSPLGSTQDAELLRSAAELVRARCRAGDVLLMGEAGQIGIIAPFCGWRGGASMAEDLRWAVSSARLHPGKAATISAGVAEHLAGENLAAWLQRAQMQLDGAIAAGRNRVSAEPKGQPEPDSGVVQLVWRDAYLSGHAGIDDQHVKMFRLANRVLEAGMGDLEGVEAQESLLCELDMLLHHVAEHFRDEEEVLAERRYAKLKQHRLAHKRLLDRASLLRDRVRAGHADLGLLTDFLAREVVVRHMLTADREYFASLHKGK